ncbi:MAG: hypothetical protein M3O78_07480 [Chloroflexota bacterium]|nr:hypothetical protein [Chloroflexota bacterium]
MAEYPDVFADGFSISANPLGVTVTLTRSDPTGEPGMHEEPKSIVARVRLSPGMAAGLGSALSQASTVTVQGPEQAETTKH